MPIYPADDPLPDEDLTTPEHLLHKPRTRVFEFEVLDPEKLGAALARGASAFLRQPENLAGLSGELLLPLIVFRGRHVPLVPFVVVALMGFAGGRMAYQSYRNLEVLAQAAQAENGAQA